MRTVVSLFLLVTVGLLCGCSSDPEEDSDGGSGVLCPAWIAQGMMIEVRDAVTGLPAACGAEATAKSDAHTESLTTGVDCNTYTDWVHMSGVYHPGTYTLTITKQGYEPWILSGIEVIGGVCGVIPVRMLVDLTPI